MIKPMYLILVALFAAGCERPKKAVNATNMQVIVPSFFVPYDSALYMMDSYVASLGANVPAQLEAWSVDAESLRQYLADTSIRNISISLAHTAQYIRQGNYGVFAGLAPDALTIIVQGVNQSGQPVRFNTSYVLNRVKPCPTVCLPRTNLQIK